MKPMEAKVAEFFEELEALSKKHGLYVIGGNVETHLDEIVATNVEYSGEYYADVEV